MSSYHYLLFCHDGIITWSLLIFKLWWQFFFDHVTLAKYIVPVGHVFLKCNMIAFYFQDQTKPFQKKVKTKNIFCKKDAWFLHYNSKEITCFIISRLPTFFLFSRSSLIKTCTGVISDNHCVQFLVQASVIKLALLLLLTWRAFLSAHLYLSITSSGDA